MNRRTVAALSFAVAFPLCVSHVQAQGRGGQAPVDQSVPADLRSMLVPHKSEMRLVVARYTQDRALLSTNYAAPNTNPFGGFGGGGGGGGGGGNGAGGNAVGGNGASSNAAVKTNGAANATGGNGAANANAANATGATGAANGTPPTNANAGGGGRGGRGAFTVDTIVSTTAVSPARIARLMRFDLSWQTALAALNTTKFSDAAKTDLDSLQRTIKNDLASLDAETNNLAQIAPLIPFSQTLVDMIEARIRVKEIDAEPAAATIDRITNDITTLQKQLEGGLADGNVGTSLRATRTQALRAAAATETIRSNLNAWFIFYDGYDPMFTWWTRLPYKHIDDALKTYASTLRDKVATANQVSSYTVSALKIDAAPAPKFAEVPDLNAIISLPQDEMTDVVARFVGSGGTGRSTGRGGNAANAPVLRDSVYFRGWLAALPQIDFDALSRNAQVDYLYIKKISEQQMSRAGKPLPTNVPRKTDNSGIVGAARGREGIIRDLQDELIPYSPEQLMTLAEREFAWCEKEMLKASRQMGFGDNWKAALEKTKTMHVPVGQQPYMVRDLIVQSIDYMRAHDLVTIPQVDAESQHMIMMTPERQLANPFFLGGNVMSVSFPTETMEFDARQQSMRGNNRPWSHATAFHESVPGHNLVGYYNSRFAGYRANLGAGGPFYGEGWPVYWETILYDMGYDGTPEEKVGALFWRMHRCARIIFSLKFHLGEWSPQQAVDFLVDRVGHERENAKAEVVRSFNGSYAPLYQAGYLLGALQLRGLRREIVDTKQVAQKDFHDEILRQGSMPITLLKLYFSKQKLTRDMSIDWPFYGDLPAAAPTP